MRFVFEKPAPAPPEGLVAGGFVAARLFLGHNCGRLNALSSTKKK